jgi:hypothetical protein
MRYAFVATVRLALEGLTEREERRWFMPMRIYRSGIQINSDTKELRPKKPHSTRISSTAWQLLRQPALASTRIIVRKQMSSARMPSGSESLAQFEPHLRVTLDVADIPRFHPVFCHYPELTPDTSVADWRAAWFSRLSSSRFQQRVSGQR